VRHFRFQRADEPCPVDGAIGAGARLHKRVDGRVRRCDRIGETKIDGPNELRQLRSAIAIHVARDEQRVAVHVRHIVAEVDEAQTGGIDAHRRDRGDDRVDEAEDALRRTAVEHVRDLTAQPAERRRPLDLRQVDACG